MHSGCVSRGYVCRGCVCGPSGAAAMCAADAGTVVYAAAVLAAALGLIRNTKTDCARQKSRSLSSLTGEAGGGGEPGSITSIARTLVGGRGGI